MVINDINLLKLLKELQGLFTHYSEQQITELVNLIKVTEFPYQINFHFKITKSLFEETGKNYYLIVKCDSKGDDLLLTYNKSFCDVILKKMKYLEIHKIFIYKLKRKS